ncbi:heme biosynthesis HemY N-terminal domain-containing protein [Aliivibrio sp. S3MY1]|uniref:heme biosynthesis HemY N-terminal domain-containing protein n=1 Tax=unclassified Aliivibrio TaxID=2645654 RepID=UPI002378009E|nr:MULTISPECIES: heme biosynthesis HemY N-terminal domain-containing protein [unclassified Aliivibrio]MDD9195360.1 heme biosynthesis HemY N-terminal domain-containing protein [Aliivibrio sp. S3MY1]MDD9198959.1 heme biosynthesis HemY N-terminal domain-containing protein [Aliivibrio sp. S2MY1]
MIRLLLLAIVLVGGLIVGTTFADQQGYVLISVADTTIEMSLTTLVIFIGALIAGLFLLEMLIKRILSVGNFTRGWFSARHLRKARYNTFKGMIKLHEGEWKDAERLITKGGRHNDFPLLNYLAAAEAAQGRQQIEQRDHYLKLASEQSDSRLAVALTSAKLQMREQQYELALATLQSVKEDYPHNPVLLELLKECYLALNEWRALKNIIHPLTKANLISEQQALALEEKAECGLMAFIATNKGTVGLLEHWNSLPKKLQKHVPVLVCLIKQLHSRKADSEAYILLRDNLKKRSDDRLIELLPTLNLADYHPATVLLEGMANYDVRNPVIQSTLAQLYMRTEKWQPARDHFEAALALREDMSDYAYLARVLEKQNRKQAAADLSRKALTMVDSQA